MADGFIVRRGGKVSEQALAPTITEVSVTDSSITFTIKNEDTQTATIVYRIDDLTAEGESISLAGGATSSNITASGLDDDTEYIVFATANVTGKVKSNVTQLAIETDLGPVYTAATGGTTNDYDSGGKRFRSHTFTSDGNFVVTTVGDNIDDRNKVDYLIIAGGGAGGSNNGDTTSGAGGGGGAGGYLTTLGDVPGGGSNPSKITVTATTFSVVVGAGGTIVTANQTARGNPGSNSSVAFTGTPTADGGGGGGARTTNPSGGNGGSGGGACGLSGTQAGGTGVSGQGFAGGSGQSDEVTFRSTGGGGGASEVGQNGGSSAPNTSGNGGNGLANLLRTGSNETRAGGGGGAVAGGTGVGGSGGGGTWPSTPNGVANTGSGGAASTGSGGAGIVVIRYEIAPSV
jgi:hypothetical protein